MGESKVEPSASKELLEEIARLSFENLAELAWQLCLTVEVHRLSMYTKFDLWNLDIRNLRGTRSWHGTLEKVKAGLADCLVKSLPNATKLPQDNFFLIEDWAEICANHELSLRAVLKGRTWVIEASSPSDCYEENGMLCAGSPDDVKTQFEAWLGSLVC